MGDFCLSFVAFFRQNQLYSHAEFLQFSNYDFSANTFEKIIFVLDADEYLERLEGKTRKCLFFYTTIF